MSKIFTHGYDKTMLSTKWWHRLAIVLIIGSTLVVMGYASWQNLFDQRHKGFKNYDSCKVAVVKFRGTFSYNCPVNYKNMFIDYGKVILITIVWFVFINFIVYRAILFITLGGKKS